MPTNAYQQNHIVAKKRWSLRYKSSIFKSSIFRNYDGESAVQRAQSHVNQAFVDKPSRKRIKVARVDARVISVVVINCRPQ